MKIAIIGLWHLGTVISTGLSSLKKNKIYCFDEDKIINKFKKKKIPINEKNINKIIKKNLNNNLFYTSNFDKLRNFDTIWITYDTIIDKNDHSNFKLIFSKLKKLFNYLKKNTLIIISSQIPIGSIRKLELYDKINLKKNFKFAYIPENLRLGNGLKIFLKSKDIIIGIRNKSVKKKINQVIDGINSKKHFISVETAEMTKHVINTYLACSIALINEISSIASKYRVSFSDLEKSVKTDKRISPNAYLRPGNSFSGGTLGRDLNYLINEGRKKSLNIKILESIILSNKKHSLWVENILNNQKNLSKKKILQIGLSYTSGTTTLRRSLPFEIFNRLKKKTNIKVYDEYLRINSSEIASIKSFFNLSYKKNKFDIIIIFNKDYSFKIIKNFLKKNSLIIDINNYYKKDCLKDNYNYISLEYGKK